MISFSLQLIAFILSIIFSIVVYKYSLQPPNLTRIPWLDRFDRPGWIKYSLLILAQVLLALGLVFFIRTVTSTRGISMLPTLAPGERIILNILPTLRGPIVRGTVVRYHVPGRPYQSISRVVALEGDTVEMKRGLLYVNSRAADNLLLISKLRAAGCIDEKMASSNTAVVGNSPERPETELKVRVPKGHIFLVSDNRAIPIEDSRYLGAIPLDNVSGVVQLNKHDDRRFTSDDCHPSSYSY